MAKKTFGIYFDAVAIIVLFVSLHECDCFTVPGHLCTWHAKATRPFLFGNRKMAVKSTVTIWCRLIDQREQNVEEQQNEQRKLIWRQIAKVWKDSPDQSNSKGIRIMTSQLPRIATLPRTQQTQLYKLMLEKLSVYANGRHYSESAHSLSLCIFFQASEGQQIPAQCVVWLVSCLFSPALGNLNSREKALELFSDLCAILLSFFGVVIYKQNKENHHWRVDSAAAKQIELDERRDRCRLNLLEDGFSSALKYLHLLRRTSKPRSLWSTANTEVMQTDTKHDVKTFNAINSHILEASKQSSAANRLAVASQIFLVYSLLTAVDEQLTYYKLSCLSNEGLRNGARCIQEIDTTSFKSLYEALSPSKEQTRRQNKFNDNIRNMVRKVYGTSASCAPFGSSVNGLATAGSDVDIILWFHQTPAERSEAVKRFRKLFFALRNRFADDEAARSLVLAARPGMQAQALFHARTPIIKLNTTDGVQADIALQVDCEPSRSALLYCSTFPMADDRRLGTCPRRHLAHPAKLEDRQAFPSACSASEGKSDLRSKKIMTARSQAWAKMRRINDASKGTLSSHGYVALLLKLCQKLEPGVLPPTGGSK
eukprot:125208-Hanusia_phi.AAC.3